VRTRPEVFAPKTVDLADAFEAVVAAVVPRSGSPPDARDLIMPLALAERIADAADGPGGRDYKPGCRRRRRRGSLGRPRLRRPRRKPGSRKRFFAAVYVNDPSVRRGRRAVQEARPSHQ